MPAKKSPSFNPAAFLTDISVGKILVQYPKESVIFPQGKQADAVYYIQKGRVKLSVVSQEGKEAIIGVLSADDFFGEGCIAGQPLRMATATAIADCALLRIEKQAIMRALHEGHRFSEFFVAHLLSRNIRYEEDLVDQLFNSSEKRLARILLLLSHFGKEGKPEPVVPQISQETLAQMVGTTRSRVSHFMNKFGSLASSIMAAACRSTAPSSAWF